MSDLKTCKATLKRISEMDFEGVSEMSNSDALSVIVTLATETLNPKSKPSAFDLKTKEVADFVMADFKLAFATNDDIAVALNTAQILSPQGKDWTRFNISKTMTAVRDLLVARVDESKNPGMDAAQAAAPDVSDASDTQSGVETDAVAVEAPESVPETFVTASVTSVTDESDDIDDILSELEGLDELAVTS